MTETLKRLIDAVEGGVAENGDFAKACSRPSSWDIEAINAYNGSLDAAKALHDVLLPGWAWSVGALSTAVWSGTSNEVAGLSGRNPARAWLLAILRAKLIEDSKTQL
jgi:hypothetical protein